MSQTPDRPDQPKESVASPGRRRALARLGIAAGIAYSAPTVLRLDRQAHAAPTPCPSPYWPGPRPATCPKKR
ncbi:MAG: hypothetical protein FJX02_16750 [Alphaproteobacteria bacterium]|nr:hypothetical protein [Alphaproteobacteria bacterium]